MMSADVQTSKLAAVNTVTEKIVDMSLLEKDAGGGRSESAKVSPDKQQKSGCNASFTSFGSVDWNPITEDDSFDAEGVPFDSSDILEDDDSFTAALEDFENPNRKPLAEDESIRSMNLKDHFEVSSAHSNTETTVSTSTYGMSAKLNESSTNSLTSPTLTLEPKSPSALKDKLRRLSGVSDKGWKANLSGSTGRSSLSLVSASASEVTSASEKKAEYSSDNDHMFSVKSKSSESFRKKKKRTSTSTKKKKKATPKGGSKTNSDLGLDSLNLKSTHSSVYSGLSEPGSVIDESNPFESKEAFVPFPEQDEDELESTHSRSSRKSSSSKPRSRSSKSSRQSRIDENGFEVQDDDDEPGMTSPQGSTRSSTRSVQGMDPRMAPGMMPMDPRMMDPRFAQNPGGVPMDPRMMGYPAGYPPNMGYPGYPMYGGYPGYPPNPSMMPPGAGKNQKKNAKSQQQQQQQNPYGYSPAQFQYMQQMMMYQQMMMQQQAMMSAEMMRRASQQDFDRSERSDGGGSYMPSDSRSVGPPSRSRVQFSSDRSVSSYAAPRFDDSRSVGMTRQSSSNNRFSHNDDARSVHSEFYPSKTSRSKGRSSSKSNTNGFSRSDDFFDRPARSDFMSGDSRSVGFLEQPRGGRNSNGFFSDDPFGDDDSDASSEGDYFDSRSVGGYSLAAPRKSHLNNFPPPSDRSVMSEFVPPRSSSRSVGSFQSTPIQVSNFTSDSAHTPVKKSAAKPKSIMKSSMKSSLKHSKSPAAADLADAVKSMGGLPPGSFVNVRNGRKKKKPKQSRLSKLIFGKKPAKKANDAPLSGTAGPATGNTKKKESSSKKKKKKIWFTNGIK